MAGASFRAVTIDDVSNDGGAAGRVIATVGPKRLAVAGFLIAQTGRLLNEGDTVEHNGARFTVEQVASRRITQVKMERIP